MKAVETTLNRNSHLWMRLRRCRRDVCLPSVALVLFVLQGCAAFHPVRGVPASYVPDEFMAQSREGRRQLDPSLLMRSRPEQHLVAGGDILSIYIPRVLGSMSSEVNEVGISPPINMPASADDPPTVGFPIQVRDDDTIKLPQIPPLNVGGMTLYEVEEAIRRAYTEESHILKPSEAMIMVSLFRAREHRVLIYRQEFTQESQPQSGQGSLNYGKSRKGTARVVRLRSGENDVAHALTMAGVDGLPGADAENMLYIIRGKGAREVMPAMGRGGMSSPVMDNVNSPSRPPINGPLPTPYAVPPGPVQQMSGQRTTMSPQAGYRQIQQMSGVQQAAGGIQRADYVVETQSAYPQPSHVQQMQHSLVTPLPYSQASVTPPVYAQSQNAQPQLQGLVQQPQLGGQMLPPPMSMQGQQHSAYPPAQYPQGMSQPPTAVSNFGHSMTVPLNPEMMRPIPAQPIQGLGPNEGGFDPMWNQVLANFDPTIDNPNVIRIPLRLREGEQVAFTEENITLYDGDIVYIESRETEVFYTGGLLGGGQYTLPRDYDLHVLEALSIAESRSSQGGQFNRSIGGVSALNQDVANSASRLLIIRKLCNGQTARIEVNIVKAMKYDHENILIKPGDMLILQYTFPEACCAFTQRFLLEGALIGIATSTFTGGQ